MAMDDDDDDVMIISEDKEDDVVLLSIETPRYIIAHRVYIRTCACSGSYSQYFGDLNVYSFTSVRCSTQFLMLVD